MIRCRRSGSACPARSAATRRSFHAPRSASLGCKIPCHCRCEQPWDSRRNSSNLSYAMQWKFELVICSHDPQEKNDPLIAAARDENSLKLRERAFHDPNSLPWLKIRLQLLGKRQARSNFVTNLV